MEKKTILFEKNKQQAVTGSRRCEAFGNILQQWDFGPSFQGGAGHPSGLGWLVNLIPS